MDGALGRLLVTVCVLLTMPGRGAALSCYYGSNDFGVQETSITCATELDACTIFKFTTATKTGTVYACTSQQNCQNPITHKTTLESAMQTSGVTGTAGNIVCCTVNNCNRQTIAANSCYYGSNDFGVQETSTTCATGLDACVTFKFTTATKTGTVYACTSQQNCQNPITHKTTLESAMQTSGVTGTAGNIVCCTVNNCNRQTIAANSCYYGSNDFGVQETSTTCATGLDACVTFKFTTATKTGIVYACTSQQNCQNPTTHKTTLESAMQTTGFTGKADNIVCCTVNNCNRQTSVANLCYIGSNTFGKQETPTTCPAGMDACVTFQFTSGTKTGNVYACTTQQNCQNPITHKTTLENGMHTTGFPGTAGSIVCCTVDNCNRAGAAATVHRVVVSMSSSPYLILPVSLLLSRVFA
ncbi:uncharacterized protein LOC133339036 isoform X3 [Lethenteron reissneri]|uniref:uncharacterized protein LOC133339036 isoform X3 n=1 Tax=Lethenteron reissneri TaxID=7753 RepID=UPI002AB6AF7F|nr:uncharacterized protein LOC133339036 isoform X3 [Lethenteron reissneri]